MGDEEIDRLLDGLRIVHDRRDIRVGDSFHRLVHIIYSTLLSRRQVTFSQTNHHLAVRGLSVEEQRRLELGLMVLNAPDTVSACCCLIKAEHRYLTLY